jgi:UDP-galactopyranose mutase
VEEYLSQEIKDYILRLHWSGYQFSAIAFKVNKAYNFPVTREMVDLLIGENLSKRASAKA